ncbi:MAG: protein kinase [Planctomycetaceae bacterium]|jgi:serine/threonine protein kinase|nr:protein kinase [Planctomycetaceae bacterium]MBT6156537.1 protein kinase [Planctomycetaceae bacterium]MBT6484670.1 protein kinase [Planctomycetaceae bacterium]MBT6493013.1 protein kinase [Planctomycetaceae bacterium]
MESVSIPCPQCGHKLQLRDRSLLGRAVRCKKCTHKFLLEETPEARRPDDSLSGRETVAPSKLAESIAEPSEHHEPILREFGRYHLLRELGQGAMGTVYLARDVQLDRQVALKIPKFRDDDESKMLERFYREARSAATLRHPNICPVFDVGELDGAHYLTMAYIEGRTLSSYINRQKMQPERQVVAIVRKLAAALGHAHKEGVVHRDLKPANIMIDVRSDPIVMDFGLALQLETGNDRLTQTGMILGTPAYMSPEQVRTEWDQVGPPSDIYSLGIILYELLTGEVPFDGPVGVVMALVLTQPPPNPSELRPDLDPQLEAICLKMMAKEIDDRYKSMREVDAALAGFLKSPKQAVPKPKSTEPALIDPAPKDENEPNSRPPQPETSRPALQTVPDIVIDIEQRSQTAGRLDNKNQLQQSRLIQWLKSPIGIAWSTAGSICAILVGSFILGAMQPSGQLVERVAVSSSDENDESESSKPQPPQSSGTVASSSDPSPQIRSKPESDAPDVVNPDPNSATPVPDKNSTGPPPTTVKSANQIDDDKLPAAEYLSVVDDYPQALNQLADHLARQLPPDSGELVWLFDQSQNMIDDRGIISQNLQEMYLQYSLRMKYYFDLESDVPPPLTTIISFGQNLSLHTQKSTSDLGAIRKSIDQIPVDESGQENMCGALATTLKLLAPAASRSKRKLAIILVTDESGDDGDSVEDVVNLAKKFETPIFILGRETNFGSPFSQLRWFDGKSKLTHWLRINRGPETAGLECLQWNGFHSRRDVFGSGLGPFEQVRIAKESGGIFFMLPGEEENILAVGVGNRRRSNLIPMSEYLPDLRSRKEYEQARQQSPFRRQIWNIIQTLNPNIDSKLDFGLMYYSMTPSEFRQQATQEIQAAWRAMTLVETALSTLEEIRPLRTEETSKRWQASYDLITAQLTTYRVRLFQFILVMDRHVTKPSKPKDTKSNKWHAVRVRTTIDPDEQEFERIKSAYRLSASHPGFLQEIKAAQTQAKTLSEFVIAEHPGTPWAQQATFEWTTGYGVKLVDRFIDPRYLNNLDKDIKLPKR